MQKFDMNGTDDFAKFGYMVTQLLALVRGSAFNSILAGIFVFFASGKVFVDFGLN